MLNCSPGGMTPESKRQGVPSSTQPLCVTVWSVGVGFSQRTGLPLVTTAFAGAKYGEPSSIIICVAMGMAVVGQARLVINRLAAAMVKDRVMG